MSRRQLTFLRQVGSMSKPYMESNHIPEASAQLIEDIYDESKLKAHRRKLINTTNRIILSNHYKKLREKIVENFVQPENAEALFKESTSKSLNIPFQEFLNPQQPTLSYSNIYIRNSIELLVTSLITSILVEFNLRCAFKQEFRDQECFLKEESYLSKIPDENAKYEILKILTKLYQLEEQPDSIEEFVKSLDQESVDYLLDVDLKQNPQFASLEQYREDFNFIKSSRFLNYSKSDVSRSIKNECVISFNLVEINNSEYLTKFENIFKSYEADDTKFKHLSLLTKLANALISSKTYTPDISIFKYLLDKFDQYGLLNYQRLVVDSLPPYQFMRSVLSDSSQIKSPKVAQSYQALVEEDPEILNSLLKYHIKQDDSKGFKELLQYFRLNEIRENNQSLSKSAAAPFLSKSRFSSKFAEIMPTITFNCSNPLLISSEVILIAIEGCIKFNLFEYIDLIFNKRVIYSTKENNKIALWLGKSSKVSETEQALLISKGLTLNEFELKLFNKKIFSLLLKASAKSNDLGRIMWLVPHLNEYLKNNLQNDDCKNHIEFIKHHVANNTETSEEFTAKDSSSPIDLELIRTIYNTLTFLKVEGLVLTYDRIFDFKSIVK